MLVSGQVLKQIWFWDRINFKKGFGTWLLLGQVFGIKLVLGQVLRQGWLWAGFGQDWFWNRDDFGTGLVLGQG